MSDRPVAMTARQSGSRQNVDEASNLNRSNIEKIILFVTLSMFSRLRRGSPGDVPEPRDEKHLPGTSRGH